MRLIAIRPWRYVSRTYELRTASYSLWRWTREISTMLSTCSDRHLKLLGLTSLPSRQVIHNEASSDNLSVLVSICRHYLSLVREHYIQLCKHMEFISRSDGIELEKYERGLSFQLQYLVQCQALQLVFWWRPLRAPAKGAISGLNNPCSWVHIRTKDDLESRVWE